MKTEKYEKNGYIKWSRYCENKTIYSAKQIILINY